VKKGPVTKIGVVSVFRISGTGHNGSRGTGSGWWAELPDGRTLAPDQGAQSWPPFPAKAVTYGAASRTKKEAVRLAEDWRRNHCPVCGGEALMEEVHAWWHPPKYAGAPLGPTGDPVPAAVRKSCAEGHEWIVDTERKKAAA
jgi:hypothetical protein